MRPPCLAPASVQAGGTPANAKQFGGSPLKVGEEEFSLFRDHELLAKINE